MNSRLMKAFRALTIKEGIPVPQSSGKGSGLLSNVISVHIRKAYSKMTSLSFLKLLEALCAQRNV